MPTPEPVPKTPPWFRTRGGQPGPTRKALDEALAEADLGGSRLVTAELARGAAELVDSARRAQDPRLWLSASQRLTALVGRLGLDDDRGAGVDDVGGPDELESVLGARPSLVEPVPGEGPCR